MAAIMIGFNSLEVARLKTALTDARNRAEALSRDKTAGPDFQREARARGIAYNDLLARVRREEIIAEDQIANLAEGRYA